MTFYDLQPSTHLIWDELKCKDGTPYPEQFKRDGRVYKLAAVFESIRSLCGNRPIKIHSAYRTPEWNHKIGGVENSQHVEGRALDLGIPEGMKLGQFYAIIWNNAYRLEIRGLGKYLTFVHIDIRPGNRLVMWNGPETLRLK